MRHIIGLPFRTLFFAGDITVRVIGFTIGFAFRALLFLTSRAGAIVLGVLIGLVIQRKRLARRV